MLDVHKMESETCIWACYRLIPHYNFTLDTIQYHIDNAVMPHTYCFTRWGIKDLPNQACECLSGFCFAELYYFILKSCTICAKFSSTLSPIVPSFLTYPHHKSKLALTTDTQRYIILIWHSVCNWLGHIYWQILFTFMSLHKWLSVFNSLKLLLAWNT